MSMPAEDFAGSVETLQKFEKGAAKFSSLPVSVKLLMQIRSS